MLFDVSMFSLIHPFLFFSLVKREGKRKGDWSKHMNTGLLFEYGINYEKGKERFLGDGALYEAVLLSFLEDTILTRAEAAMQSKDYAALFECAHELKGACGNVDMFELFEITTKMVDYLRQAQIEDIIVEQYFQKMKQTYLRTQEGIRLANGEG